MQTSVKSLESYQEGRMKFSSSLTFMVTCLGFSAGFGSVWRFPYLVFKNGGGAFLIPYFILVFVLAIPLFYLEVALGQMKGMGLAHILQIEKPKLRGFGYMGITIGFIISTYYNLIMAYSLVFLWDSLEYPLPWTSPEDSTHAAPSKDFFYQEILNISSSIGDINSIQWSLALAYIVSQGLVYFCIKDGVQTSGKVAIYTATSPYILLCLLFLRGIFLEGSMDGLYYLFVPDVSKLFNPMTWVDAANQVVFQMAVGQGVLSLYGSYRHKKDDVLTFALLIPLLTAFCGMLASLVVFSYIGHISFTTNIPINDLPLQGPDLAFVLYPAILAQMPLANLWCIVFFTILVLLGIDSQFGYMDAMAGTLEDAYLGELHIFNYKLSLPQTRLLVCFVVTCVGMIYCTDIGFYLLNFVDSYGTSISFMCLILFEAVFFGKSDRFNLLREELMRHNNKVPALIGLSLVWVAKYLIIALLFFSIYSQIMLSFKYSAGFVLLGWCISLFPLGVAGYLYKYASNGDGQLGDLAANEIELDLLDKQ